MSSSRKRFISSCIPCYTRKQKCNREYPCNHCTRRQRTDDCFYNSSTGSQISSPTAVPEPQGEASHRPLSLRNDWDAYAKPVIPTTGPWSGPSLAESFGYFENSDNNTLALIQKLGLLRNDTTPESSPTLVPEAAEEVHRAIKRMPDRQTIDYLVQYFAAEVNWMDQLVYMPWFLARYQAWWIVERVTLVAGVDFAVLILRICSYTLQFLPSPGYTLDTIRGVMLADIRNICDETAENLEAISTAADSRGSLIRVQHLAFFGLQCRIEAKTNAFWEVLSHAIRVAQNVGIHCEAVSAWKGTDKTDREMERRTFCNLYIWDSLCSRQLDRIPSHPGRLRPGTWPQLHLLRNGGGVDDTEAGSEVPDTFTERLLQARLADFWRSVGRGQGAEYDMITAEKTYERFCHEYISQLPQVFAVFNPDETWDKRLPKLAMQRKLLHMAIYDSICWNFRPLLVRPAVPLPLYKSVILSSQKRILAAAALRALDSVKQLHALIGDCHTRLPSLVFSTFEAAVLLVYLYSDPMFPEDCPPQHIPPPGSLKMDPLHAAICNVTRNECLQAATGALKRLKMLAEVSSMADVGANTLIQLLSRASENSAETEASLIPNQEFGNSRATLNTTLNTTRIATTGSQQGATSAPASLAPWLPNDLVDLRSVNDFMAMNGTLALGDMASWPSFDTSNMYSQNME